MSIILISSDVPDIETMIAEKVAKEKGYDRLDRDRLTGEATPETDPESLKEALDNTPSLLRRLPAKKWRYYLACIEAEVLERLLTDNVVCSGLGAHLFVIGVSHAMKIRVLGGKKETARLAEEKGKSPEKAEQERIESNRQRAEWSLTAFDQDETDPGLYDLVISLDQIDPIEAVRTIVGASEYRKFQSMTYSTKCLTDLALSAKVRVALLNDMSDVDVQARDGSVVVETRALRHRKREKIEAIKQLAGEIDGVGYVEVHVQNNIFKKKE